MVVDLNWEDGDNRKEEVINNLWRFWRAVSCYVKDEIQTRKAYADYLKLGENGADGGKNSLQNIFLKR